MHPTEIDIRYLVRGLRDQLFTIFLFTVLGGVLAVAYIFVSKPEFTSTALLRVDPTFGTAVTQASLSTGPEAIGTHIESEMIFITSDRVLARVVDNLSLLESEEFGAKPGLIDGLIARLGVPNFTAEPTRAALTEETIQNVRKALTVGRVGTSLLVEVRARSSAPDTAANLANAAVAAYFQESIEKTRSSFANLIAGQRGALPAALTALEADQDAFESYIAQSASDLGLNKFMLFAADRFNDEIEHAVRLATSTGKLTTEESTEIISLWNAVKVRQQTYDSLLAGISETARQAATISAPATIQIGASVPARPVSPNKILALGLGLVLGFISGSVRALFRAQSHGRVRVPEDLGSLQADIPVEVIPRRGRKAPALQNEISSPNTPFAQAVWRLQAALCADMAGEEDSDGKVVMVSPVKSQGQEIGLAFALAKSLSVAGYRTVFVSLAPPHPRRQRLQVRADTSISKLMLGADGAGADKVLSKLPQEDVAVILNDGSHQDEMYASLFSPRLGELLFELKAQFDFVVMETAAVTEHVDATYFAQAADAIVVEVPVGTVRRSEFARANELLQGARRDEAAVMVVLTGARH